MFDTQTEISISGNQMDHAEGSIDPSSLHENNTGLRWPIQYSCARRARDAHPLMLHVLRANISLRYMYSLRGGVSHQSSSPLLITTQPQGKYRCTGLTLADKTGDDESFTLVFCTSSSATSGLTSIMFSKMLSVAKTAAASSLLSSRRLVSRCISSSSALCSSIASTSACASSSCTDSSTT